MSDEVNNESDSFITDEPVEKVPEPDSTPLETEEVEENESEDEEEDDSEDTEEIEDEEEVEEDESEEEKSKQFNRPIFAEVKKKYPNFFKDFPDMREVYFRENKFSTYFPTVEDAEEAFNKAGELDKFAINLVNGSTKIILDELEKATNGKNLVANVAHNFLPELEFRNRDLYFSVINPVLERFVRGIYDEGLRTGNENLKVAAQWFAQATWNHIDVDKLGKRAESNPEIEAERQKLRVREAQIENERISEVYAGVATRANNLLVTEISKVTSGIKDEYLRAVALRDIFTALNDTLTKDQRHMRLMDSLWAKAKASGFQAEHKKRILSTLLARAKQQLPSVAKGIMAQIEKTDKEKPTKKKIVGKVSDKDNTDNAILGSSKPGKVDWSKYKSEREFIDAYRTNPKAIHRLT